MALAVALEAMGQPLIHKAPKEVSEADVPQSDQEQDVNQKKILDVSKPAQPRCLERCW